MVFRDRAEAGRRLAEMLLPLRGQHPVVLGLPRGGVPVAAEVARALAAPLDVIVVRKLGVPSQPELAMGAIGEGGARFLNQQVLHAAGVTQGELERVEQRERLELDRRAQRFRSGHPHVPLAGRTAVIVDDGIATGSTARAACQVARTLGAARVVLAAPVAAADAVQDLRSQADEVICVDVPPFFQAVGQWYVDFRATTDDEVVRLLTEARAAGEDDPEDPPGQQDDSVEFRAGRSLLGGRLTVPEGASGVVLFAHGSGSSRHSPRNRAVASALNSRGLATLLFDLLTRDEEVDRANVFDVELLGSRLVAATAWLRTRPALTELPVGYFGASTGAAAALWAAAEPGNHIGAVVSRGGRPDLAGGRLSAVRSPTLLVVGQRDPAVLELNRRAAALLRCEYRITVVPGATHLFEEPGALRTVAGLACDWFCTHLLAGRVPSAPLRSGR